MSTRDDALRRGLELQRAGRFEEALGVYAALAAERPDDSEVLVRAATCESALGRHADAVARLEAVIARDPHPPFRFAYADALERAGRIPEAVSCLERLAADAPGLAPAQARLGELLVATGRAEAAVAPLEAAARLRPGHAATHCNLAYANLLAGRLAEAERCALAALAAEPAHARAQAVLAQAMLRQGALTRGERELTAAANAAPASVALWVQLANVRLDLGHVPDALDAFDRAIALDPPDRAQIESARILAMHYDDRAGPGELAAAHRAWAARHAGEAPPRPARRAHRGARLRIGYVSPRLHDSSPARLLAGVLEHHDRSRFDVVCYACSAREDEMTRRLQRAATEWRHAAAWPDEALCERLRADGIDIAVDLAGHTPDHRLGAFARRPAAVAVSWLDYFDTTGLEAIDALLTDRWHSPPGDPSWYRETLVRLPGLRLCWEPPDAAPAPRQARTDGDKFTFGSFNRLSKLSPATLALWCAVLRAVPDSRLVVKSPALDNPEEHGVLRERFAREGIDPARIEPRAASPHRRMLEEYGDIHLALDTSPYSGCVVTLEALWMGTPVLTLPGETFASRQSAAILACAGLDALVAADAADFVARAERFAGAGQAPAGPELRERMAAAGITDFRAFTRGLEAAFEALWSSAP